MTPAARPGPAPAAPETATGQTATGQTATGQAATTRIATRQTGAGPPLPPTPTPALLAQLHARSFVMPRPWSEPEFAGLLAAEGTFLVAAADGFALARVVAGEAELLTLAVAPEARRRGVGRQILSGVMAEAAARACRSLFLEVAADNVAALALYRSAGFADVGRRRNYYTGPSGQKTDALVLSARPSPALPES